MNAYYMHRVAQMRFRQARGWLKSSDPVYRSRNNALVFLCEAIFWRDRARAVTDAG
jgi:hypothetical protein